VVEKNTHTAREAPSMPIRKSKSVKIRVIRVIRVLFNLSIRKKIKNIPQHGRIRLIELGVTAAGAGDGCEFFVLDVENLGKSAAGGAEHAGFVSRVAAFWALVSLMLHEMLLSKFGNQPRRARCAAER
jgi:hypothetical protein